MNYLDYQQQVLMCMHILRTRTSMMLIQRLVHAHNLLEPWSLRKGEVTPIDFDEFEISLHQQVDFQVSDEESR